jgi:hypothetical protein
LTSVLKFSLFAIRDAKLPATSGRDGESTTGTDPKRGTKIVSFIY